MRVVCLLALSLFIVLCVGCGRRQPGASVDGLGAVPGTGPADTEEVTALTKELLAKNDDDQLWMVVDEYVLHKIGSDYSREYEVVKHLPEGIRAVHLVAYADGEVNNGGYGQYFVNSEGKFAQQTVAAYDLLGAPRYAGLMKRAVATFAAEMTPAELKKAKIDIRAFASYEKTTDLSKLDDEYYSLAKKQDPAVFCGKYIRAHPDQFITK